jgi:zinc transporter 1/2/3
MERWEAKIIALLLIFFLPLIFTLLPYKLSGYFNNKGAKGRKVLSCMMCFGGGVFFATFMLHLGPEVREMLHSSLMVPYNIHYPIADLSMAFGFFLVLYIEKFAVRYSTKRQKNKSKNSPKRLPPVLNGNSLKENGKCGASGDGNDCSKDACKMNGNCHGNAKCIKDAEDCHVVDVTTKFLDKSSASECHSNRNGGDNVYVIGHGHGHGLTHGSDCVVEDIVLDLHGTRSLILMLALSLHRIFDGMGVGLQQKTQNVWNLLIAVVCHEVVIGFSLGLDFMKNNYTWRRLLITAFLCSLIMPIGILIGIGISEFGNETAELQIVNGLLQGLTCGTFIYVTFMEILHEEMDAMDTSVAKVTSVLMGFGLMALLCAVPEGGAIDVISAGNTTAVVDSVSTAYTAGIQSTAVY